MPIDDVLGVLRFTLALWVHWTLGRPHATVERPHAHTFHVAKVHCVSHGLFVHPLHGLKGGRTSNKPHFYFGLLHCDDTQRHQRLTTRNPSSQRLKDCRGVHRIARIALLKYWAVLNAFKIFQPRRENDPTTTHIPTFKDRNFLSMHTEGQGHFENVETCSQQTLEC